VDVSVFPVLGQFCLDFLTLVKAAFDSVQFFEDGDKASIKCAGIVQENRKVEPGKVRVGLRHVCVFQGRDCYLQLSAIGFEFQLLLISFCVRSDELLFQCAQLHVEGTGFGFHHAEVSKFGGHRSFFFFEPEKLQLKRVEV
jgi:hypothetical protein